MDPIPNNAASLEPAPISDDVRGVLEMLRRLAALSGEFSHLTSAPLDAMLTNKQCAKWLQLSVREVNAKALDRLIPSVLVSGQTRRFHPRTILEQGHAKAAMPPQKRRKRNACKSLNENPKNKTASQAAT